MNSGKDKSLLKTHRIALIVLLATIAVLSALFFLIRQSQNFSPAFISNYVLIFTLRIVIFLLVLAFLFVFFRDLIKLVVERRRRILGSRFKTKLVAAFLLIAFIPSLFLFWTAWELIIKNVESWFNPPVEKVLTNALDIADEYYAITADESKRFAGQLSMLVREKQLMDEDRSHMLQSVMEEKLQEYHLDMVSVFTPDGKPLTVLNPASLPVLEFDIISDNDLKKVLDGRKFSRWDPLSGGQMFRAGYPVMSTFNRDIVGVVVVGRYIPANLAEMTNMIKDNFEEYQQMKLQKGKIKTIWIGTYGLIYLVILFSALWLGFYLARTITVPIMALAEATREISSGNLDYQVSAEAGDELGLLIASFNEMTYDLKISKGELEHANEDLRFTNEELDKRRRYIEAILENIPTGVVSVDSEGRLSSLNKAACRILKIEKDGEGFRYDDIFGSGDLEQIKLLIDRFFGKVGILISREISLSIGRVSLSLAVNLASLVDSKGIYQGMILVVEDLTELSRAQRVAAWREVAKKMAHEIKNPLTPIQLSAQRILKKYQGGDAEYRQLLRECVTSITEEVNALKYLVDEFSRFAKLPTPRPVEVDVTDVVINTLKLYDGMDDSIEFKTRFSENVPNIKADPEQLKRVIVNLVDNAVEAMKNNGTIEVTIDYDSVLQTVKLGIRDTGEGIPPRDREKLFVPYFSTKREGTGLGLAIVNRIVRDHNGRITVSENKPRGSVFTVEIPA